jgi:hypothetical protein
MKEWSEADDYLYVLGASCIALAASGLKLFLGEVASDVGVSVNPASFKKAGAFGGYRDALEPALGVDWKAYPGDLTILEQVFLARNADQHRKHFGSVRAVHPDSLRARFPTPFFIADHTARVLATEPEAGWFLGVAVGVSRERVEAALNEIGRFGRWLGEIVKKT